MLKNLVKKVVEFAAEHSTTVKEQLDAYKGVQKALSDTESFKATEVSEWVEKINEVVLADRS